MRVKEGNYKGIFSIAFILIGLLTFHIVMDIQLLGDMEEVMRTEGMHIESIEELEDRYNIVEDAQKVEKGYDGEISWLKEGMFNKGIKIERDRDKGYNKELEIEEYERVVMLRESIKINIRITIVLIFIVLVLRVLTEIIIIKSNRNVKKVINR